MAHGGPTPRPYDPERFVRPGSQRWQERVAINELYKAGRVQEYKNAKATLLAKLDKESGKRKKNGPVVLALELRHGDMVVMHGEEIQEVYEVCISNRSLSSYRRFSELYKI